MKNTNNIKNFIAYLNLIIILYYFTSCDISKPSKPFFNMEVNQLEEKIVNFDDLESGQHIAGSLKFCYNSDTLNLNIRYVSVLVDYEQIISDNQVPYEFEINTSDWQDGKHIISVAVYENNPNLGLLSLLNSPSIILSQSLIFDQTPPTPVILDSISWDQGFPKLKWSKNNDSNFYAYIIKRKLGNCSEERIDTVYNCNTTYYTDLDISNFYSQNIGYYNVEVFNRSNKVSSNNRNFNFGKPFPISSRLIYSPLLREMDNEILIFGNLYLYAVSTTNHEILRSIKIYNGFNNNEYNVSKGSLSADKSVLYLLAKRIGNNLSSVIILNANTFDVINIIDFSFYIPPMIIGNENRLYFVNNYGHFYIINATTGTEIFKLENFSIEGGVFFSFTDSTNIIYLYDSMLANGYANFYRADVSNDSLNILNKKLIQDKHFFHFYFNSDINELFVCHKENYIYSYVTLEKWHPTELTVINTIQTSLNDFSSWLFSSSYIYTSEIENNACFPNYGKVVQYEKNTFTPINTWYFEHCPSVGATSPSENEIYTFRNQPIENWIVNTE